jgi:hypothetical protein
VKNNLIIDIEERRVRYLSRTYAGRIHDKRICDEEDYTWFGVQFDWTPHWV